VREADTTKSSDKSFGGYREAVLGDPEIALLDP